MAALAFTPAASAATANCGPATGRGANGPTDYAGYCWIDFSGYNDALARGAGGQPFTVSLAGGGSMTFTLNVTGASPAITAATMPSWSGAPMGQSAFTGVPGSPVLYQATNGTTNTITLSSITVTVGAGGQVPYAFVAADAESTNNGESVNFSTNGSAWTLLATMQNGSSTLYPTLSGVGTTTVSEAGVAGTVGAYAFASGSNPTTISSTMVGGGLQGIAFAVKYMATDVQITSTPGGTLTVGGSGSYTLRVKNNGPDDYDTSKTFTVTDTLPTGLAYASASGTGWSCGAVGQLVTCTANATLTSGSNLPDITLNVSVAADAPASVLHTASVAVNGYDSVASNNTATNTTSITQPDMSGSSKDVEDVDGGLAKPGDTLRYTIHLVAAAGVGATNLKVTDVLDAKLGSLAVVSIPAGATNASAGNTLTVTGISMPAGGTADIVFTAVIAGSATDGDIIGNTATILTSGNNTLATATSSTITVATTQPPASGNKFLYLNTSNTLTRARPGSGTMTLASTGNGSCFTLAALPGALNLSSAAISVTLRVMRSNTTIGNRRLRLRLFQNGTVTSLATTPADINVGTAAYNGYANATWPTITLNDTAFTAAQYIVACVQNLDGGTRPVYLNQNDGGNYSYLKLNASTVVNVDSVAVYAAAYGSTTTKARYLQGEHAYIRAVVSDPFGNADITGATLKLTDAGGTVQLAAGAMTSVATTATTRTYEYDYTLANNPRIGGWTADVTAKEGQEDGSATYPQVTHTGTGGFPVEGRLSLRKAWVGGIAGDAVSLAIGGGSTATGGSSAYSPATMTAATATAVASATLTLAEAYTSGLAGAYTKTFSCVRDKDSAALAYGGTLMSHTITMPNDSAVTCTFTNTWNVPLTVVKLATTYSDPVNGTTYPKAIPGAIVEYQIIVTNPGSNPADSGSVFIKDQLPVQLLLLVADIGGSGSGPVSYTNGSPVSGMTYTFASLSSTTDDIAFSNNDGASWTYSPVAGGDGTDPAVTGIRINPQGAFNGGNAQFTLKFHARIK